MPTHRELFLRHVAQTSDTPLALEITASDGVYLFDAKGKKYIDLISGIAVSNLGHNHPAIVQAIKKQAGAFTHLMVYGEYVQHPQTKLAQKLASVLPASLSSAYFVNSGSEAVEGALKLAKRFTGRAGVVCFENAYHGSTQGALSVCGNVAYKRAFYPLLPQIHLLKYNTSNLDAIDETVACVIVEPVQAESGVTLPHKNFLKELRKKCTETGALLIFDEIQTGLGRTGSLFAFQQSKVIPDILVLAKAFGAGLPLGAFISSREIMQCLTNNPVLGHITTNGGNALSCAASLASLNYLIRNKKLLEKVEVKSALFQSSLKSKKIKQIRAKGLLMAVEFESFELAKAIIDICIEWGVITDWFLFNPACMRIAPPLIITEKQIKKSCEVINQAILQV